MPKKDTPQKIQALNGIDSIRARPEMFVGNVDDPASVTELLKEAACLALDNVVSGCAANMQISLASDGVVSIFDDGPGLNIRPDEFGRSIVEIIFTCLHACRERKKSTIHTKQLCGLGIVVTNALSEWLIYETSQDGRIWRQEYARGAAKGEIKGYEAASDARQQLTFLPDKGIFGETLISADSFIAWFKSLSLPIHSANITLMDSDGKILQLSPQ